LVGCATLWRLADAQFARRQRAAAPSIFSCSEVIMKPEFKMLLAVSALILSACVYSGPDFSMEDARKVKPGMTEEQVKNILGPPNGTFVDTAGETWTWTHIKAIPGKADIKSFVARFKDGVVIHTGASRQNGGTK